MPKITIDLTSLSGFASLSAGSHSITVVAKASGYRDSDMSTAVTYNKKMPTPVIALSGDTISVSNISDFEKIAVVFNYTITSDSDGTRYTRSSNTSFNLSDYLESKVAPGGDYTITCIATATNFTNSDVSNSESYEYPGLSLPTPKISLSNDRISVTNTSAFADYSPTYTWYATDPNSTSTITLAAGSSAYIDMLGHVGTIDEEFGTSGYCKVYVKVSSAYIASNPASSIVVYKQTVVTPTITISGQTLAVTNAGSVGLNATYTIYYGTGAKVGTFTGSSKDLSVYNLSAGTYKMYVIASRDNFFDSDKSNTASYTQLTKLATPTALSVNGTTLTATGDENATNYDVFANGVSIGLHTV